MKPWTPRSADTYCRIACVIVLLALQSNSSSTEVQEIEKQQVEHLRVCMLISEGFERVVTIAPSEPLVTEAARKLMLRGKYELDMPSSLSKILEILVWIKGTEAIVVGAILLTTHDSAFASTVAKARTKRAISTKSSTSSPLIDLEQTRA